MTSQLSKNLRITRRNTRPWNRLHVAVLSTSVLLNLATVAPAADPPVATGRRTVANGVPSQSAAERWKRAKSQYQATQAPASRAQQPARTVDDVSTVRTIPDDEPATVPSTTIPSTPVSLNETGAADAGTVIPTRTPDPARTPEVPAAINPAEQEPEWVLPVRVAPEDLENDSLTAEEILSRPEEDSPRVIDSKPAAPLGTRPPYEEEGATKTPGDSITPDRGTQRPLTAQVKGGPPRKTTQVRRIGDIAPLNDFDKDTEIMQYAAEKAREFNVRFGGEAYTPRNFPEVAMPWTPPTSRYYPLYFEDPALERYGHTHHPLLQPVVSSARFSAQLALLPYQMTIKPPCEMRSPLGWYRPGDVVPKLHYPFPWSAKAAAVEAAAVVGFIYLIP